MKPQILSSKSSHPGDLFNKKDINCNLVKMFLINTFSKRFFSSYYDILDVSQNASHKTIKQKYYQLRHCFSSKKFHPDLHKNNKEICKKFLKIKEAYEVLTHKTKRKEYDERMGINQKMNSKSFGAAKNVFYNGLYRETIENAHSFEHGNKDGYKGSFSDCQYTQESLYNNSHINYDTHYETYYTYEKYRMKYLKEKKFPISKEGTCSTKFLGISTIVLIIILLSSFSHFKNKKSKKYSPFQEPLSQQTIY
ncbi:uncharacterized protein T551_01258 [Pneumocystis jirovecii RU7]|uniref:J domain-containing protein n=1 Tax=Pneumocystis jirovecii (strain RU7) TaxID=1408657 RepID=A0A0W4ZS37_PNEJ7|nr:uncharacterized protein T551_01258 [Pneumocystis jirovecii RU7]KTW31185.1 hypothetical protein T551_01258 [Pneumocystis jirovecii RU7]